MTLFLSLVLCRTEVIVNVPIFLGVLYKKCQIRSGVKHEISKTTCISLFVATLVFEYIYNDQLH